ncbi:MAG: four helix bundle protein [Chitinophagales bacterium]|jgi:four helix bundle protein|nr:four helix bundle protein [Sphingobacteriales bacterium]
MHKLEDLIVWKKSIQLVKEVYLILPLLPKEEKYGLIDQIRRSSISIPSNIAEGAGRNNPSEFNHFLGIANGSSYELFTQLILVVELNMLEIEKIQSLLEMNIEIQKMIYGFKNSLMSK